MFKKVTLYVCMVTLLVSVTLHAEEAKTMDLVQEANEMTTETVSNDFNQPGGMTIDSDGTVLVADIYNNLIVRLTDGVSETLAGTIGTKDLFGFPIGALIDGKVTEAYFNHPRDLVSGANGIIYVADTDNHAIRKIADGMVTTIAGTGLEGKANGRAGEASFRYPSGIAMHENGNLYVADTLNNVIRMVTPSGVVSTLELKSSSTWKMDHVLNEPSDVCIDASGVLYILDAGNQQIKKVVDGVVTIVSGVTGTLETDGYRQQGFMDGSNNEASFNFPKSITVHDGVIYVADTWNHAVRMIKEDGQTSTLIGTGVASDVVGSIADATLNGPSGLAIKNGTLYIADRWNNAVKRVNLSYGHVVYDLDEGYARSGTTYTSREDGQINVAIDKTLVTYDDVEPVIYQDHSYFPIRVICEQLGASVDYEVSTRTVILDYNGKHVTYPLDADYMIIRNDRSLIPIRKLATDLGFFVTWLDDSRTVVIHPLVNAN